MNLPPARPRRGYCRDTAQAMAQVNAEIVRKAFDAINAFLRGDGSGERLAELFDWEMEVEADNEHLRSAMDFMRWLEATREPLDELRLDPDEFIEAGPHVVVPMTVHLVARGGSEVQVRVTWRWTIRRGNIERIDMYQGRREAVDAVERTSWRSS